MVQSLAYGANIGIICEKALGFRLFNAIFALSAGGGLLAAARRTIT